jgi:hypothetical protein
MTLEDTLVSITLSVIVLMILAGMHLFREVVRVLTKVKILLRAVEEHGRLTDAERQRAGSIYSQMKDVITKEPDAVGAKVDKAMEKYPELTAAKVVEKIERLKSSDSAELPPGLPGTVGHDKTPGT